MARLSLRQWWNRMAASSPSGRLAGRPGRPPTRLHLERLEGRCVPSTFTTIDPPGSYYTYGINNLGQVVGYYQGSVNHGFLLSGGVYTTIDPPGSVLTEAHGINDSGQIVGFYFDQDQNLHGFLLSGGVYTT